ncbi:hypothetical protein QFZ70_001457 [Arthrobacter sp. V1I9]|uniref:hypothetical protein n=1 Tax=Arthrobacter sp. V1I9 TaxID=3042275 RepID=UPI002794804E|nr:hypothetical protein [Arthrobacter sp. V1I9]MDQ0868984.1 hypothetical protein [Arthrobacter sp. V1I9]
MTEDEWADLARQLVEAVKDDAPSATDWISAVSSAATLAIAILAALVAAWQLREAKKARIQTKKLELEKAQPYVVVYMEESISPEFIDLVIRNYGQTAAFDVKLQLDPLPTRTQQDAEVVELPEVIPVLAPGQEWRTHWDSATERYDSDLPERHEGTVTYWGPRDVYKDKLTSEAILDWSIYKLRRRMVKYGIHDVASSIREMTVTHKKWTQGARGLSVIARDGDARDEKERQKFLEGMEEAEAANQGQAKE